MSSPRAVRRPVRWDMPFSGEFSPCFAIADADIERLRALPSLRDIDETGFPPWSTLRDILRNDARLRRYDANEIVFRTGTWGNSAFHILSGKVRVEVEPARLSRQAGSLGPAEANGIALFARLSRRWGTLGAGSERTDSIDAIDQNANRSGERSGIYLQDVSTVVDPNRTTRLEEGQWFGEAGALGRTPRSATVRADGPTELLEIRWQGLRDIMRNDRAGGFKRSLEESFRKRTLESFLRAEPLFRRSNPQQMAALIDQSRLESFGAYDALPSFTALAARGGDDASEDEPIVVEEGDYPNGMVFIRSGVARIVERHHRGSRTVGYLTAGQSFGLDELKEGWRTGKAVPLRRSLRALGYVDVVVVPTALVERFAFDEGRSDGADKRSTIPVGSSASPGDGFDDSLLEFLVDRRYVQGASTMVIDLDRCTRCDDCVRACAATHDGVARFDRGGQRHERYLMANACIQCANPVCLIECPTGAIGRDLDQGLVVINESTCIGCSLCATNCPYDAIRMIELRADDGRVLVDDVAGQPLLMATKCDLCMGRPSGPACQNECRYGALTRIDMRRADSLGSVFAE